jgi:hypothetical protein
MKFDVWLDSVESGNIRSEIAGATVVIGNAKETDLSFPDAERKVLALMEKAFDGGHDVGVAEERANQKESKGWC